MVFPKEDFNKASVKDADVNKQVLADLFDKIEEERYNIHSLMLIKSGSRVFRANAFDHSEQTRENVYSVSKAFTSIAIGILIDQGLLNLEDYVLLFFKQEVTSYLPAYESLKVKHLLTMTVGQELDVFKDLSKTDNVFETFFNQPMSSKPGEVFMYSNFASFMLSAIVTKVTGKSLNDFLDEHVYQVIGIEKPVWPALNGINLGATGLEISTNDMARFGILLLNDGLWEDKQVVSKAYLDAATKEQVNAGEYHGNIGYGYQFWMNAFGGFRAAGYLGQNIIVIKEFDLVIVNIAREERFFTNLLGEKILEAAKLGWSYCNFSLRDYTRRFKSNSESLIKAESKQA